MKESETLPAFIDNSCCTSCLRNRFVVWSSCRGIDWAQSKAMGIAISAIGMKSLVGILGKQSLTMDCMCRVQALGF